MSKLTIQEHKSSSYGPRTYFNAASADVTVAIAVDHNTAGEKCTQKAAGDKIIKCTMQNNSIIEARNIWCFLKERNAHVINIAGNGIYTLVKNGWDQHSTNLLLFKTFEIISKHWKIDKIVCGGQSGVDLAGAVTAYKLGIDCVVTMPKGFKMRWEDGVDREYSEDVVRRMIEEYSYCL